MTRIKYLREGDFLIYNEALLHNKLLLVCLNTKYLTFDISDTNDCIPFTWGSASTLQKLKRKVRNELVKLGVKFIGEVRSSSKTRKYKV